MAEVTLADVVRVLDARYPSAWAESWDAVGLTCGDPTRVIRRILFAVDPVDAVVTEALASETDLVITHHPLLLSSVNSVATTAPKGALLHRLIQGNCALFTAHTNADVALPGVSDALAQSLGLQDLRPLRPLEGGESTLAETTHKVVVFVPVDHAAAVLDAMADAGAGVIGNYDRCAWTTVGTGTFRPGPSASPTIGSVGVVSDVLEVRVEAVTPSARTRAVIEAMLVAHPYEEPAFDVFDRVSVATTAELDRVAGSGGRSGRGLGRIGTLPEPMSVSAFVQMVADALPVGAGGVRAAGDPDRLIQSVAVCGGAGDSLLDEVARAGVDAYVTGDLRHHRAGEFLEPSAARHPVLVDATHFGTEWPWLQQATDLLAGDLAALGATVDIAVSTTVTDPWSLHAVNEGSLS